MSIFSNAYNLLVNVWHTEPARVVAVVSSAVVFVATNFGVVVQETNVTTAVTLLLTVLLSGEVIRSKVSPAASSQPPTI